MNRGRRPGGGTPSGTSGKSSTRAVLVKPRSLAAQPPGTSGIPASLRKILCSLAYAKHYLTFGTISLPCEPDMSWRMSSRRDFTARNEWHYCSPRYPTAHSTMMSHRRHLVRCHPITNSATLSRRRVSQSVTAKCMTAKCVAPKCVAAKCVASTQCMTAMR